MPAIGAKPDATLQPLRKNRWQRAQAGAGAGEAYPSDSEQGRKSAAKVTCGRIDRENRPPSKEAANEKPGAGNKKGRKGRGKGKSKPEGRGSSKSLSEEQSVSTEDGNNGEVQAKTPAALVAPAMAKESVEEPQAAAKRPQEGLEDACQTDEVQDEAAQDTWSVPLEVDEAAQETQGPAAEADEELFMNTCRHCGETFLLVLDIGEEFACADIGKPCQEALEVTDSVPGAPAAPGVEDKEDTLQDGMCPVRYQLLCRVIAEGLTAFDAAALFLKEGLEAPQPSELDACRTQQQQRRHEVAAEGRSRAAYEAEKLKAKRQQRYLNGQVVEVSRGSKYLVEQKESAEAKAKTSCSIPILGPHCHGTNDKKKKGPRS